MKFIPKQFRPIFILQLKVCNKKFPSESPMEEWIQRQPSCLKVRGSNSAPGNFGKSCFTTKVWTHTPASETIKLALQGLGITPSIRDRCDNYLVSPLLKVKKVNLSQSAITYQPMALAAASHSGGKRVNNFQYWCRQKSFQHCYKTELVSQQK